MKTLLAAALVLVLSIALTSSASAQGLVGAPSDALPRYGLPGKNGDYPLAMPEQSPGDKPEVAQPGKPTKIPGSMAPMTPPLKADESGEVIGQKTKVQDLSRRVDIRWVFMAYLSGGFVLGFLTAMAIFRKPYSRRLEIARSR